ncbi:hypothetical protein GOV12_04620 [Candidatus Pacearchaeota archaeon]|nr:hypothetical protein [Candidatus Pacearchaeota archaeon]
MVKKRKHKNMFVIAFMITFSIILVFIIFSFIFSYFSKDDNEIINNDKSSLNSLSNALGKPVRSYSDKNSYDKYDEDLGRKGEFCNVSNICGICKECNEETNKCIDIDDNIDPGYCEEDIYEGTKSNGEFFCLSGICAIIKCIPSCTRLDTTIKQCGPDGCTGSCGECMEAQYCDTSGYCRNLTTNISSFSQPGIGESTGDKAKITLNKYNFNSICNYCPNNDTYLTKENLALEICCDENEICYYNKQKNFPPFCNANQKNPKKKYIVCLGENYYSDLSKWCNNDLTYCSLVNRGIPECKIRDNLIVGNPSFTSTTSIYFVRNKESFTLNGISYVIKPHLTYKKPIKISVNTNFYPDNYETFKFNDEEEIFRICNKTLIIETTKEINNLGGIISLENSITIEIPKDSLTNSTEIIIQKFNLSNCQINDNEKFIYDILKTVTINKSLSPENTIEKPLKDNFPYLIVFSITLFLAGIGYLYFKLIKNFKEYEKIKLTKIKQDKEKEKYNNN